MTGPPTTVGTRSPRRDPSRRPRLAVGQAIGIGRNGVQAAGRAEPVIVDEAPAASTARDRATWPTSLAASAAPPGRILPARRRQGFPCEFPNRCEIKLEDRTSAATLLAARGAPCAGPGRMPRPGATAPGRR